ncbi:MAG: ATPase [Flavobacteriales bacterium]|nr:ATPase [Flavobacteriales bacterium]
MLLIADSGSTKTDWRLVSDSGERRSYETIGFNPYFIDSASVLNELASSRLAEIRKEVTHVFFYGAGCSSEEKCKVIFNPLNTFFSNARVEVEHDMLAAARATCGKEKGMVAILGTGSNSCLYNGNTIVENVAALGYVLGDNGSGADIGKTFIQAYLGGELPGVVSEDFREQYNLSLTDILDAVYKQPLPNRFLAGFSLFVHQHLNNPTIKKMVEERFSLFFEKNICKYSDYRNYPLHLVGSIAANYQEVFEKVAAKYQVKIGGIVRKPIESLVDFHQL